MDASVSREGWNRGKLCKLRFIFRQNDPSLCCIFVQNLGASVNTYTDSAGGDWELRYISRELCDCSWTFVSDGIKPWTFIQCTLQGNRFHHWWHNLCKDLSTTTLSSASWSGMLQRQVYRSVKTLLNFVIVTYISFNTNQKSLLTT